MLKPLYRIMLWALLLVGLADLTDAATITLPKTGQTGCWDASGNSIACSGTGQDGDKLKGAAWPSPRFVDNSNGTITDNLTGLIWLKNANCFGVQAWSTALASSNSLASGSCGLTDSSSAGQWRLPNRKELLSILNYQQVNNATWLGTQGFSNVQAAEYWTSSSYSGSPASKWIIHLNLYGFFLSYYGDSANTYTVWPVRDYRNSGGITAGGTPTIADALKALQYLNGQTTLTSLEQEYGDIAPLWPDKTPKGDGVVNVYDVIGILRKVAGL